MSARPEGCCARLLPSVCTRQSEMNQWCVDGSTASCPFGQTTKLHVSVDPDLMQYDDVWAAVGMWNDNFGAAPTDIVDGVALAEPKCVGHTVRVILRWDHECCLRPSCRGSRRARVGAIGDIPIRSTMFGGRIFVVPADLVEQRSGSAGRGPGVVGVLHASGDSRHGCGCEVATFIADHITADGWAA